MYQCKTPVVLLVFKRAEETARVFEVVRQVKPPKLLVVADGPRADRPDEPAKCAATRAVIDGVDWECEVLTNYADVNLGCKERVSSGLHWVFSLVEEAIIVEDDCVPDASFFRYCDELLEKYRDCPQVMSVTGENTHGYQNPDASYSFSYYSFYWGWATWRRAWELFDGKMELWAGLRKTNWLSNLLQDEDATAYWAKIFDQTFDGFNSWGWAWSFACFVNQGLCAVANNNLITNIGFGPDAAHHTWTVDELGGIPIEPAEFPLVHPPTILRDLEADLAIDNVRFSGRQKFRSFRKQGLKQLDKGNDKKALEFFEKCLQLRPDLIGLNYAKAVAQAKLKNKGGAIASLQEILTHDPQHEKSQLLLAYLQGKSSDNGNLLEESIELEDLTSSLPLSTIYQPVPKAEKPKPTIVPAKDRSGETTIFAIPKAFHGHIGIIQRNAITSWTKLEPRPEIILFGEDEGTAEIAEELGIIHVPHIKCNEFGTPMLDDIFAQAQQLATKDVVTYVNADIMLLQDFVAAVKEISQQHEEFMAIGRRWDIDITELWDFTDPNWLSELRNLITHEGVLHNVTGKDYFCFPKNLFAEIPAFAVGRAKWDNWMIHEALTSKYRVVDATQGVMAIHQNHDYRHLKGGKLESSRGKEAMQNKLAGGTDFSGTIADANEQYIPSSDRGASRVSVIVTAHNQAGTINSAIDSILSQTYENCEIIIVDRNSSDNLQEKINTYGDRVSYIRQESDSLLEALNLGIKEAKGELITFLDAGSSFLPNKLREQLKQFDKRGSLELVNSGWQILDESGAVAQELEPWKQLSKLEPEEMHVWKLWKLWGKFPLAAVMFRNSHLKAIEGFNTELHPEVAIVDLILRLSARGCLGSWLKQPTCCYPEADNLDSLNTDNLEAVASSFELLLDGFFNNELTADWMQILKSQAYYNVWVFSAWLMHQNSHHEKRDAYLKKSLAYTSYSGKEATQDWNDKFSKFAKESGIKFDSQTLKNSVVVKN